MRYSADELEMMIESYLAGTLDAQARMSFEHAMSQEAEIREAVALQRELDRSLRTAFVPPRTPNADEVIRAAKELTGPTAEPAKEQSLKLAGEGIAPVPKLHTRRWMWMAIAAAVLLTAAGVFRGVLGGQDFKLVPPDQMYSFLQNGGWKPAQVCNTPTEFAKLVRRRLGQGLIPDMAGAAAGGVALLGWGYEDDYNGSPLSKNTMMLLTTVRGERVLVLIDQKKNRRDLRVRAGSSLQIHEQEIGSLIVYEVTPASTPTVIPLLSDAPE